MLSFFLPRSRLYYCFWLRDSFCVESASLSKIVSLIELGSPTAVVIRNRCKINLDPSREASNMDPTRIRNTGGKYFSLEFPVFS